MGEVYPVLSRKLEKSALILGKIANLWVKFPIYRSNPGDVLQEKVFLEVLFFLVLELKYLSKCSNSKKNRLPSQIPG